MNIRKAIAMAGLLVLAVAPPASQAAREDVAIDACVKSFVQTHLQDRSVRVRKKVPAPGPLSVYTPKSYTVALSARGARSGELIAQARCVTDANGTVIVLDSPPPERYVSTADFTVAIK